MLMGSSLDQRLVSAYRRQTEMFRRGAELMRLPPERRARTIVSRLLKQVMKPSCFARKTGSSQKPIDHRTDLPANGRSAAAREPVSIAERSANGRHMGRGSTL
jgi:hypothetical protein